MGPIPSYTALIRDKSDAPREALSLALMTALSGIAMGASMAVVNAVVGGGEAGATLPNLLLFALLALLLEPPLKLPPTSNRLIHLPIEKIPPMRVADLRNCSRSNFISRKLINISF